MPKMALHLLLLGCMTTSKIGNDWGSTSQHPKPAVKVIDDDSYIQITLRDTETNNEMHISIGTSHTLKELFTKFSEEQGIPLRSLRFAFNEKALFLSSVSKKTPAQLGLSNGDIIHVSSSSPLSSATRNDIQTLSNTKPKRKTKRRIKKCRSKDHKAAYVEQQEDPKVLHSHALSRLFDEAGPHFRAIRKRLNNLTLERTLPKEKVSAMKQTPPTQPVMNPNMVGIAGKAGKTSYSILVGEIDNLYKSSKKSQAQNPSQMIDLHGCNQIEALDKLNQSLPQWEKYAMEGSYPFVAPVVIVCGGGNQILSDTVSQWIKENNVSNAPKKKTYKYARAA
jgi:DNA-nicking Smr family endonuclease